MKHGIIALIGLTIFAFSVMPVSATPGNGNGKGPGDDGGCSQTKGGTCEPDRGNECSNGQHTGNPHCGGEDPTPTVTPTVEPTASPTSVPTVVPTVIPTATPESPEQPQDDPQPTPSPTPVPVTPSVTPTPVVVLLPPVVVTPVATPDFDISQITALPHAGDGSAADEGEGSSDFFAHLFFAALGFFGGVYTVTGSPFRFRK